MYLNSGRRENHFNSLFDYLQLCHLIDYVDFRVKMILTKIFTVRQIIPINFGGHPVVPSIRWIKNNSTMMQMLDLYMDVWFSA